MKLRGAVLLVATLAAAAGTARLGVWQLDRAAQKTQLQQKLDSQRLLPPLPAAELADDAMAALAQHQRRTVLEGRWLRAATVYLENRQMNGRPGFYVVTPLQLADGSAVLVQRGWQPRDMQDRTRVATPPTPADSVRVAGRIAPPPSRLYAPGADATGPVRQNIDVEAYAREIRLRLRPLSIVQEDGTPAPQDGLLRQWPQPATGVEKHHGYAFQWFLISALILGLYAWFQLIRPRRQRA